MFEYKKFLEKPIRIKKTNPRLANIIANAIIFARQNKHFLFPLSSLSGKEEVSIKAHLDRCYV